MLLWQISILEMDRGLFRVWVHILTLVIYQTPLHPGTLLVKNEQSPKLSDYLKKGQYLIWPVERCFHRIDPTLLENLLFIYKSIIICSIRGTLKTLSIIHRAKLLPAISPQPINQQGSRCCFYFLTITSSYHSKVNLVSALDAAKLATTVLLYVL